jgi:FkbM family methyltransferase
MTRLRNLFGPLLAPWLVLAGRATGSPRFFSKAAQLDPHSFRPQLLKAAAEQTLTVTPGRLLTATKLALACRGADQVILDNLAKSHGQLLQDVVALISSNLKRNGYFVEVGVGDGVNVSNTLLLERDYEWQGLLIEPNRDSHSNISRTRKAQLITKAAYSRGGERVVFTGMSGNGELSGISAHLDKSRVTDTTQQYEVETATLDQLLEQAQAPLNIDFMSIDTEGSELEILKGLSLNKWQVNFFAIEHNSQPGKLEALNAMLKPHGYIQVLTTVSEFDGWFVHSRTASRFLTT